MLDFTKLARQMQGMSHHLAQEATLSRQRVELARNCLQHAETRQEQLSHHHQAWRDSLAFVAAEPLEPLATRKRISPAPDIHTVLATDGSQISPSHHEIAYCYLLNVGRVVLHYGQNRAPWMDSVPEVFYRPEDLYIARKWGIRTEEWMGYRRTTQESIVLAELAEQILDTSTVAPSPVLAMVDGSLIHWFLESLPTEARNLILPLILQAWETLRQLQVPLVGYLSASRSNESLNFLRLNACPYPEPDCANHCPKGVDAAPCSTLSALRDATLWGTWLEPGERGSLWRSSARIQEQYGEQAIYFCYVHVGSEVARLDFPAWVAADPSKLETALSLVLAQVQKGYGYPVALAEAHNQAVVRSGDRNRFFGLLEQQMIRAGIRDIGTSYKEARKRGSIA
jgi:hypothetical protein